MVLYALEIPFQLRGLVKGIGITDTGTIVVQYEKTMIMDSLHMDDTELLSVPVLWAKTSLISFHMRPASGAEGE